MHYQDIFMYMLCKQGMSTLPLIKPFKTRKLLNLSYQALRACFKLYKVLASLNTNFGYVGSRNTGGCLTYTSSSMKQFKNALLTSILRV